MKRLVFDIETDGFVDKLTVVHSLVIKDTDTGEVWSHTDASSDYPTGIASGLLMLMEADELIGHNIIKFDLPALQKVYPWFQPKGRLIDTLVLTRLIWPEIKDTDKLLAKRGKLPSHMVGRYGLESFGYRLGLWKGDYSEMMKAKGLDPWASWNQEMQDYCVQDVEVNDLLFWRCWAKWQDLATPEATRIPYSDRSIHMEMEVARIVARQEAWGFAFDVKAAERFYVSLLAERDIWSANLKEVFPPWLASGGQMVPKLDRAMNRKDLPILGYEENKKGVLKRDKDGHFKPIYVKENYTKGAAYTKVVEVEFNPNSNHHVANRLGKLYGWRPQEFTPSGEVKVDETILSQLPYPEAAPLTTYRTITKRISQLAEGKQAWMKKEKNGRIHGGVITTGAVTRRMTHQGPNVAQTPTNHSPYGKECRSLFTSTAGFVLVGCDADALELRCLGGYMARYDGGEYIETILKGDKSNGTDMHSVNCRALGMDPTKLYAIDGKQLTGRDVAKTWFYAFIYGSGDWNLGVVLGVRGFESKIKAAGTASRKSFVTNLPALGKLIEQVKKRAASRGFIIALDGGKLPVRKAHAALNTLLQSAGAIIMKVALVILDNDLQSLGLSPGRDYEFTANVHDEWQLDVLPEHVELVKQRAEASIKQAGEDLEFKCPLAGNAGAGSNWAETH